MSSTMNISTAEILERRRGERADVLSSRDCERIRSEYTEMPGLVLTLPQAARLWGLTARRTERLLSALVSSGFLLCDKKRSYRRRR
jgi:hypothetical protein